MIEIKGKYNTAKVFVDDYDKLEEACYKQIKEQSTLDVGTHFRFNYLI